MALIRIQYHLLMVGLVSLGITSPAIAEVTEDKPVVLSLAQTNIVQIIDVELQVTLTGIEVFLRTADSQLAIPVTSIVENNFIADIPNAVLSLAANEFQALEPTVGIAQVTVTNLPGNRVRIEVLRGPRSSIV
ncbi:MAG: AMIN domain-containing protein [Cyanobacteria bacterium P01_F01_bin.143]